MVKNPAMWLPWVQSLGWEDPWRKEQLTTTVWPREFHRQRSLAGYSPWGRKELDTTERLSLFTTIYKMGFAGDLMGKESPAEKNGYTLQYSCLENSMDRGAWQAIVHGVAKSRTRLNN